jgi:PAS domain S-box-containing protein
MNIDSRIHFILGITPDDLEQSIEGTRRLIHPDDWPAVYAELEQVRHGKTDNFENEHRMLRSDGGWCWISARGRVILHDEDGRARKVFGIFTDISARREVEAARMELEQRLTKLVAQVPGVVYQYRQRPDGSGYFRMPARILWIFTIRRRKKRQRILLFCLSTFIPGSAATARQY